MGPKAAMTVASLLLGVSPLAQEAHAEEGAITLEARCHVEVKHAHQFGGQTIRYYEQLCAITNAAGSGFMHNVSMFGAVWSESSEAATRLIGHNIIIDQDKDEIYMSLAREGVPPEVSVGRWSITGGNGKYRGASGSGTYELTWLPPVVDGSFLNVVTLEGRYRIP